MIQAALGQIETMLNTKSVVGDPLTVGEYTIIPLISIGFGAGIAGMVSAVTANGLGKRVAVVEKRKLGGNCTNFTCISNKTLIRLSHTNREISRLVSFGLLAGESTAMVSPNVMAHIRSVVRKAYEKDVPETFEQIGVTMISGAATSPVECKIFCSYSSGL